MCLLIIDLIYWFWCLDRYLSSSLQRQVHPFILTLSADRGCLLQAFRWGWGGEHTHTNRIENWVCDWRFYWLQYTSCCCGWSCRRWWFLGAQAAGLAAATCAGEEKQLRESVADTRQASVCAKQHPRKTKGLSSLSSLKIKCRDFHYRDVSDWSALRLADRCSCPVTF